MPARARLLSRHLPNHVRRRVCFVTGTRAEFGLMQTVLGAVREHRGLELQIIATGMHLDPAHGDGLHSIREMGWKIDAKIPWPAKSGEDLTKHAGNTGAAIAGLAAAFAKLNSEVVLVVGDRVEAFAAAAAAHIAGRIVAHVHGGDRAAGQVDDALRHAITKLAHLHFPATQQSAERIAKLGEDAWRIHRCGAPGIDGIRKAAAPWRDLSERYPALIRRQFALAVYHPVDADAKIEARRASELFSSAADQFSHVIAIHPNNDPGSAGIRRALADVQKDDRFTVERDVPRNVFLGLMRDAAVLVGNSSSGIIEAASFGAPVLDVGPRQLGREHGDNVHHCVCESSAIVRALKRLSSAPRPKAINIYGSGSTGRHIARVLANVRLNDRLARKLISY